MAGEVFIKLLFSETLLTWPEPLPNQLRHIRIIMFFSVRIYCFDNSVVLFKISMQASYHLIDFLPRDENLVVFESTFFSVLYCEQ